MSCHGSLTSRAVLTAQIFDYIFLPSVGNLVNRVFLCASLQGQAWMPPGDIAKGSDEVLTCYTLAFKIMCG